MAEWTCPECDRLFGRSAQSHDCAPGLSLEEYFESGPCQERAVFDAVMAHVTALGLVHTDVVSVGIFLENRLTFAELRSRDRWVAISFSLRRGAEDPTITRTVVGYGGRFWHVANLRGPGDMGDELPGLLTEAYRDNPL